MRKYFFFTMVVGLIGAIAITSCSKQADESYPLPGTVWIGSPLYDVKSNQYYNGDVMHILTLNGSGAGKILTIDNHISRNAITVTPNKSVTWTQDGNNLNVSTNLSALLPGKTELLKGDVSFSNRNVNFLRPDTTYIAFDNIDLSTPLATKVFRGTFVKVGTTTTLDCVWIFLSGKGWKMMVPGYPVTIYPLSRYSVDNTGKLQVDFFGGTASSSVPIDYTNHKGTYTASNDSIVYNSTLVPAANVYPNSYNWRGVFRLKEVK